MILNQLNISRDRYGSHPTRLCGTIEYAGDDGEIKVNLTQEHCAAIIQIVAEAMVKTSRELAANLTANIIEQTKSLPAPKANGPLEAAPQHPDDNIPF